MGESRCELLESSSKMFYVIFHQETDPKVNKLFYEIIYCKCGAKKSPVLQGLIVRYLFILSSIQVPEPITQMNVTRNYEKFIVSSTKCLQLWCIKHYCDFLTFIGYIKNS